MPYMTTGAQAGGSEYATLPMAAAVTVAAAVTAAAVATG
jgi:hypothetical protein